MTAPQLRTVLCPVDLSEQSQAALYHAAGFAARKESRLVVLRVNASADESVAERAALTQELNEFTRAVLPTWVERHTRPDILVRSGEPAPTILAVAEEVSADLIVTGTRGRGGITLALLGSTAARILKETRVPVAIVPPTRAEVISLGESRAAFHFGAVLAPIDLQAPSAAQLRWAAQLSSDAKNPLVVLHVVPPGGARGSELDRVRAAAGPAQSVPGFRVMVREGRVVPEIIGAAREESAGLIVMGRNADDPGAMAYEIIRRTNAMLLMVP